MERPKTELERVGERCAQVIADWRGLSSAQIEARGLLLIADFAWALGAHVEVSLEPAERYAVSTAPVVSG